MVFQVKERNVELIRIAIADEYGIDETASGVYAEVVAESIDKTIDLMFDVKSEARKDEIGG